MDTTNDNDGHGDMDICRVCRLTGNDTLYHPCLCTGSIKYIHQDCLLQWLKYSKKDVCELCNHKFSFRPLYRPDMPERLPLRDLLRGLVPLMAARTHRLVFSGFISSIFSSRFLLLFSTENIAMDIVRGSLVVTLFLCTFISLVWLREQIMVGGPANVLYLPDEQQLSDSTPRIQHDDFNLTTSDEENKPTTSASINNAEKMDNTTELSGDEGTSKTNDNIQNKFPLQHFQPVQPALIHEESQSLNQHPQAENSRLDSQEQNAQQQQNDDDQGLDVPPVAAEFVEQQRFADELTWQRLLGLDGSFAFIEHVFWTISLNAVFNIVFLYFPAQIGASILTLIGLDYGKKLIYFELPISILPMTGVTLDERIRNFRHFPSSSTFLHWLTGMVYVFYSASFILILRELLRPGVLWFIRNLHDPDFNPIQEMIERPITHHLRRLVASMTLFFSIILIVVYLPLRLIKWGHPSTIPYIFSGSADTPLVEYSFELVLLQVIMPTILEYSKAFSLLKRAVRCWCRIVGGWLDLDSYLLPSEKDKNNADQREQQRQRARQRLMRGDQNEQLGLLEVLEAIEDDTTDEEREDDDQEEDDNENVQNEDKENSEDVSQRDDSSKSGGSGSTAHFIPPSDIEIENNAELQQNNINNVLNDDIHVQQQNEPGDHQAHQRVQEQREQRNLGAQHHALLHFRDTALTMEYVRPNFFPLRIVMLLICFAITAVLLAVAAYFIPGFHYFYLIIKKILHGDVNLNILVTIGRTLFSKFALTSQSSQIHDLYSIATGVYTCWILTRLVSMAQEWLQKGWSYMKRVFNTAVWLSFRVFAAAFPLLVVIPFMLGFYFQMLVISPLRVIYADGIWNFQLKDLYVNMVIPIGNALSFLIAFPYVASKFIMLFIEANRENQVIIIRYSYPFFLGSICIVAFLIWQWKKLTMLAQKIRNDKYLIGTQLVNFYRDNTPAMRANNVQTSNITETKK
uniref:RING-type E3 ubiquitin transferase n=1 Tax=Meloidogyne hapla TaxID=6305 RepID=A0A1I8BDA0_MELHA